MALSLPIVIPSPAASSSASTDDSAPPRTPISPSMTSSAPPAPSNNPASASNDGGLKRKPSRRANTAERRATHNAVERQRRETLNGRFLDLAALLPNLQQIRRPSKSSIVNSSIAHIHASRRHRVLASRELRLLKVEADALRRELNEWRDRAGIPRVEEPVRGEGFAVVLGGELEVLVVNGVGEEGDDDAEFGPYPSIDGQGGLYEMGEEEEMVARQQHEQAAAAAQAQALHMARLQAQAPPPSNPPSRRPTISLPSGPSIPPPSATTPHGHSMTPGAGMLGGHGPMIASPTQMQFDGHNPVLGTHAHSPHGHSPMHGHAHQDMFSGQPIETDKLSAWNMYPHGQQQHYTNQQQQIMAQQQQQQQYMIQQQQYHPQMMQGGMQIKRERSSSIGSRSSTSSGSGSVSPHHVGGSPPQHFDGGMGFEAQWMMGGGITKGGMVV